MLNYWLIKSNTLKMKLKKYLSSKGRGAAKELAAKLGISASHLSQIVSGTTSVSASRCIEIEKATGGEVSRKDLRRDWRDIWPDIP